MCSQYIQIYSLDGIYKRTLKINTIIEDRQVYNLNDETLLVYNEVIVQPGREDKTKKNPYSLVSKKDGSLISVLNIHLPKRYSDQKVITDKNNYTTVSLYFAHNMHYGQDLVIADMSADTLYILTQNKVLTPILTRRPSVHSSEPPTIWTTFLTTDTFILMGLTPLEFGKGGKIPVLMYEFETGETSKGRILDKEYNRGWSLGQSPITEKNKTAQFIQPSSIIDAYKKKRLKGEVEKLAKTLDETDNPVVRIIKFR